MHQRGGGDGPATPFAADELIGLHDRIGDEDLVESGMPVHLLERLHLDAGLAHVQDEIAQPRVLGLVPVGAGQQQAPIGFLRAGGPELLSVDDPVVALQVCARDRACGVGPAARLAEQLAPGLFACQAGTQVALLLLIGAMGQDGGGGQHADADLGHADSADARELFVNHRHQARRQVASIPLRWPVRRTPA